MTTIIFPTTNNFEAGYESDEPTPMQRARWAVIEKTLAARRALGVVNGRDWTGVVVEHPAKCQGVCCVAETPCVAITLGWGDMAELDYYAERAAETPAQAEERRKKEAAAEEAASARIVDYSVNKKLGKWCSKEGEMKFRVPRPCKYQSLFMARTCAGCGAKVPEGEDKCHAKKGHMICGEELKGCWAHEKNHSCIYVHPDEPQWHDALTGTLCYDRDRQVFHLRGEMPAARNFSALARPSRNEGRGRREQGGRR